MKFREANIIFINIIRLKKKCCVCLPLCRPRGGKEGGWIVGNLHSPLKRGGGVRKRVQALPVRGSRLWYWIKMNWNTDTSATRVNALRINCICAQKILNSDFVSANLGNGRRILGSSRFSQRVHWFSSKNFLKRLTVSLQTPMQFPVQHQPLGHFVASHLTGL